MWFGLNQGVTVDVCSNACLSAFIADWTSKNPVRDVTASGTEPVPPELETVVAQALELKRQTPGL
jgi:hypothetical protein